MISVEDFVFLPFAAAAFGPDDAGQYEVVVNAYWFVHPEKGYAFFRRGRHLTPQCNTDPRVVTAFPFYTELGFEVHRVPLVVCRLPREITPLNQDAVDRVLSQ